MEDIKELSSQDFMCILLLMALFPTKETEELFRKYTEQTEKICYNSTKE